MKVLTFFNLAAILHNISYTIIYILLNKSDILLSILLVDTYHKCTYYVYIINQCRLSVNIYDSCHNNAIDKTCTHEKGTK